MGEGEHIHGGDIWGLKGKDFIDFSANINPLGPPSEVNNAIINSLKETIHYPDPHCRELGLLMARNKGVAFDQVLCGNGAVELIYLLAHWLRPKKTLIPQPTFSEYGHAIKAAHGEIVEYFFKEDQGFVLDKSDLLSVLRDVDLLILCNPNNPTGLLIDREDLLEIVSYAKKMGTFVLIDEAFLDFLPDYQERTLIPFLKDFDNLIILYSMTKFFAIPGLRLGAAFSSPRVIKGLRAIKDPWSVNHLAQKAGIACLLDKEYVKKTREHIIQERDFLYNQLTTRTLLEVAKPSVNYIFVGLNNYNINATTLFNRLLEMGILIRNCNSYPGLGERYIRIAVKGRADNEKLIDRLLKALEEV